jgi:hypothetical protein
MLPSASKWQKSARTGTILHQFWHYFAAKTDHFSAIYCQILQLFSEFVSIWQYLSLATRDVGEKSKVKAIVIPDG